MTLNEYMKQKIDELIQTNLYKDVIFHHAIDIQISRNGTIENFIFSYSDLEKHVVENRSTLGEELVNGAKVVIEILPKGKRKYDTKSYYVSYE